MAMIYYFLPDDPVLVVRVTGMATTEEGQKIFRESMKYLEEKGVSHLYRVGDISQLEMSDEDFEKAIHDAIEIYRNRGGATDPRIVPISVVGNEQSIAFVNEIKRRGQLDYPVFDNMDDALAYVYWLLDEEGRRYA